MKAIKILFISLAVLVVLLVGAVFAVANLVDPNDYKDRIAQRVQEQTGRSLVIEGDLQWALWPKLRLTSGPVRLGNAPGFGDEPFLSAEEFQVAVATWPLLRSRVIMDTVQLYGARINLARNAEGVGNWEDLARPAEPEAEPRPLPFAALALGGVDIRDAALSWRDAASGQEADITDLSVSTGALTFGDPVAVKIAFKAKANQPALDSAVTVDGTVAYDLRAQRYTLKPLSATAALKGKNVPGGAADVKLDAVLDLNLKAGQAVIENLTVSGLGTELAGDVEIRNLKADAPAAKGRLAARGEDLAQLFQTFDLPLGQQLAGVQDRGFRLQTEFAADLQRGLVSVPALDAQLLGATVKGHLAAKEIQTNTPDVSGELAAQGSDLPSLLALGAQLRPGADLKALNAALAGLKDRSFQAAATFGSDGAQVTVPSLQAQGLTSTVNGNLQIRDILADQPAVAGKLALEGADLPLLLGVAGAFQGTEGAGLRAAAAQLAKGKDKGFKVDTQFSTDPKAGTASVPALDARLLGAQVAGNLQVANLQREQPTIKGKLSASGPDFPALVTVAAAMQGGKGSGIEGLAGELAKVKDKSFSVTAEFDTDPQGNVTLPALDAKLLGATVKGSLAAQNLQTGQPALRGKLNAQGPDLPALVTVAAGLRGAEGAGLADLAAQLAKVNDKSFDLAAEFDTNLQQGRVHLPALAAKGLGASVEGNLKAANIHDPKGAIEGRLALRGTEPGPLLAALGQAPMAETVKGIVLDAGFSGSTGDLTLSPLGLKATLGGKAVPQGPVEVGVSAGSARANLDQQTLAVRQLAVTGMGMDIKGDLDASQIFDAPSYNAKLNVAPFNLRAVLQAFGQRLPEMADGKSFTKVALTTDIAGRPKSLSIKPLDLVLDDSRIKGDLVINDIARPDLQFGFGIDNLDADRYLPPKRDKPATPDAAAAGAAQLPVELLRSIRIKGDLLVGNLKYSGLRMANVKLSINGADGNILVNPLEAQLYDGTYAGTLGVNATGKLPVVNVENTLTGVQAGPLLRDLQGKERIRGRADLRYRLTATGADTEAMKRTLAGDGAFNFTNGAIKGVNIGRLLRTASAAAQGRALSADEREMETDFSELTGTVQVSQGVISNQDLDLKSPLLRIGGKGTANIVTERVDYTLSTTVARTAEGQGGPELAQLSGVSIPIRVTGTFDNLTYSPDLAAAGLQFARDKVEQKVQEKIQDKLGDIIRLPGQRTQETAPTAPADQPAQTAPPPEEPKPASPEEQVKDAIKKLLPF